MDHVERAGDACVELGAGNAAQLEGVGEVAGHGHVGKQRVVLKYHADVALVWRDEGDSRSPKRISPLSGRMKPASTISSVVLPDPDGPRRVMNSPLAISRLTLSSAAVRP